MPRTLRRILAIATVIAVVVGLVAFGVRSLLDRVDLPFAEGARCELPGTPYSLSTEQAANAATIAAVATTRRLPDRAAAVALATALQESKLVNVGHGDRDSIGLFQQRPSQGWGTPSQVQQPHYAASRFYDKLVTVRGWQRRPLTEAAQAVQQSAYPNAYQQWEGQATALAQAFSGSTAAAVSCRFPAPTKVATPDRVVQLLNTDLPSERLAVVPRGAEVGPAGWAAAHWLVAHADRLGIDSVAHRGQRWTRTDGWQPDAAAPRGRVRFQVAEPAQDAS